MEKEELRKLKETKNIGLTYLVLSIIFLILFACFIPLAIVVRRRVTYFMFYSIEAIFAYIFAACFLLFLTLAIVMFLKYRKQIKE